MILKSKYEISDRRDMLKFITNSPKTILEVGCREGLFTKNVKSNYEIVDSWGVEPDKDCEEEAKKNIDNLRIEFFNKDIKLPLSYFDLIVFNDVLEHMYDPWEALIKSKELLNNSGIIIVSLPNIRYKDVLKDLLFKDEFNYKESGVLDITHLRFFTKKTMINLFESTGYKILNISPIEYPEKKRWYKFITKPLKKLFHFCTNYRFESIKYAQYSFTLILKDN